MKLLSFRIKNFRSILDSGWQNLSIDCITGLIGQNESGKTSILEALDSFDKGEISPDILRSDESFPEVSCSFQIEKEELEEISSENILPDGLIEKINQKGNRINLTRRWESLDKNVLFLEETDLKQIFSESKDSAETAEPSEGVTKVENQSADETPEAAAEKIEKPKIITEEEFTESVFSYTPNFEFFEDFASLLPNSIDLEDLQNKNTSAEGYKGAKNLLQIAGLDLQIFDSGNIRLITNKIDNLNQTVTANFQEFWQQKIGKSNKIGIEFELKHHDQNTGDKVGKPYLVFWVKDGREKLFPKQRSKGVRWFLSFYLQLKASSMESNEAGTIFLIDEPGSSLHARAQEDVIKVFEEIKDKIHIIYTTHSPYLIKLDNLYRLLAVQRANEDNDKSETLVLNAHELGGASKDTLSPIYALMGIDFCHQQVIRKENNVLLEELSAFYYLSSFWQLTGSDQSAYFMPATGTSNVPTLANLFLGWGLDFIVVIDDDNSGRKIYNELKKNLFGDDDIKAKERLMKIKDCNGIEDLFSKSDFKKHILEESGINFSETNSEYMKKNRKSKALYALKFKLKVGKGEVKINDLNKQTQENIKKLITEIEELLKKNLSPVDIPQNQENILEEIPT